MLTLISGIASASSLMTIVLLVLCLRLRSQRDYWKDRARKDGQTNLLNKGEFKRVLLAKAGRADRRSQGVLSVIIADLNKLKETNDCVGHHAGDKLIEGFAGVLLEEFRGSDAIARTGGDEFAIIVETPSADDVAKLEKRLCELAEDSKISVSMGSAQINRYVPSVACAVEDALRAADRAMYKHKQLHHDRRA